MKTAEPTSSGISSKTRLVLGAAGLLLFIVGARKTLRSDPGGSRGDRSSEQRPE